MAILCHLWHVPCHMRRFYQCLPVFSFVWQGGSNCPTRWFQLSDKAVPTVRQNLPIRAIVTTLSGKQDQFRLKQGNPHSLNQWSQFSNGSNPPTYFTSSIVLYRRAIFEELIPCTAVLVWQLELYFPVLPSRWCNMGPYRPSRELCCGSTRKYTWSGEKY